MNRTGVRTPGRLYAGTTAPSTSGMWTTSRPAAFARALLAGLRNAPEDARLAALLAGVTPGPDLAAASTVARELWRGGVRTVVVSSLPKERPGRVWAL